MSEAAITDEGRAMVEELRYGHNRLAYLCIERAQDDEMDAGAVCVYCSDGFEALAWKRRALRLADEVARLRAGGQ